MDQGDTAGAEDIHRHRVVGDRPSQAKQREPASQTPISLSQLAQNILSSHQVARTTVDSFRPFPSDVVSLHACSAHLVLVGPRAVRATDQPSRSACPGGSDADAHSIRSDQRRRRGRHARKK